jgi:hypothetical protein
VFYFRVSWCISLEGHDNLCEDGLYTSRDSNQAYSIYKLHVYAYLLGTRIFVLHSRTDLTQYRWLSAKALSEGERQGYVNVCYTEAEVTLRPRVSRSVSLGVRPPSGPRDQFFFLLDIFFRQLMVCYFAANSLMRGLVRNLLLLLVLDSAVTLGLPSLTRGHVCLLSSFC